MNQDENRKRKKSIQTQSSNWYDVEDQNGVWRVGFCIQRDQCHKGLAPQPHSCRYLKKKLYCDHSGKIAPIRTKTMGLTVPQGRPIRKLISVLEIKDMTGKIGLLQLMSDQTEYSADKIRVILRTQLLILIDSIVSTPYQLLNTLKMVDLHINKLFITIVEYYLRLLEGSSKKIVGLMHSNQTAMQLYNSTFELAIVISIILGINPRSRSFYDSAINRTVTPRGFLQCFIRSETGFLPFRLLFKNLGLLNKLDDRICRIALQTIQLFILICQNYNRQLFQGNSLLSNSRLIMQQLVSLIKIFNQKHKNINQLIKSKPSLLSSIDTLYIKLFPNSNFSIRNVLEQSKIKINQQQPKVIIEQPKKVNKANLLNVQSIKDKGIQQLKSLSSMRSEKYLLKIGKLPPQDNQNGGGGLARMRSQRYFQRKIKNQQPTNPNVVNFDIQMQNQKFKSFQKRIQQLQNLLIKAPKINLLPSKQISPQSYQNLGQQSFLNTLEWAIQSGDVAYCQKLVSWRRSLLQLGRIAGWQVALSVGSQTFKKQQIQPEDIISASFSQMLRLSQNK